MTTLVSSITTVACVPTVVTITSVTNINTNSSDGYGYLCYQGCRCFYGHYGCFITKVTNGAWLRGSQEHSRHFLSYII
jgi:hypothetical protein